MSNSSAARNMISDRRDFIRNFSGMELNRIDLSGFSALDYHIWFAHSNKLPGLQEVNRIDQTLNYRKVYAGLLEYWTGDG
jgi:hypothetical protein